MKKLTLAALSALIMASSAGAFANDAKAPEAAAQKKHEEIAAKCEKEFGKDAAKVKECIDTHNKAASATPAAAKSL